jgi:hypothetical protein
MIKKAYLEYKDMFWVNTFLTHLDKALDNISKISTRAYKDFVYSKIVATDRGGFNNHSLLSSLCEVCIINTFILQSDCPESFLYEPKLRKDNRKNVEFSIRINNTRYNIEVKSPNLNNYYRQLEQKIEENSVVMRFDTRAFEKPTEAYQMPSPSIRVKDFLEDSNFKFPESNLQNQMNVLIIAWDENTDQPCIEMKHPIHGLLTPNSWHKDDNGEPVLFPNIDLIFVSDLYRNIIAHMSSGSDFLPSVLTGVPYFERNMRFPHDKINPFSLPFSRNVLIKPDMDINDILIRKAIFSLPIAFSDQEIQVVDEEYVIKHGIDIKFSYKS